MGRDDSQGADAHHRFVDYVMKVFGKTFEVVVAIIGDRTPTNKVFMRTIGLIFIGCHSHRFYLAMKGYLSNHQECIESVKALLQKLYNEIPAAKLHTFTHLTVRAGNETNWSSTFLILTRFFKIKGYLGQLSLPKIDALFPEEMQVMEFKIILKLLTDFESITKAL